MFLIKFPTSAATTLLPNSSSLVSIFSNYKSAQHDYKFNQPIIVTFLPGSLTSVAGASKPRTKEVWNNVCVTQENLIGITPSKYNWLISIWKNLCLSTPFFSASGSNQKDAAYMNIKRVSALPR